MRGDPLDNLVPAEVGNDRALTHGAYARLRLSEAAGETADVLRGDVPIVDDADEAAVQMLAYCLEQMKCAAKALEDAANGTGRKGREDMLRLSQDARGWVNTGLNVAAALGMTPAARAKLGLNVVKAQAVSRRNFNPDRLSPDERRELDRLVAKAEVRDGS